ncbi:MAG: hypothetical protein IJ437_07445 [Clostridia bacterium]|nr:hypothetical protein [Clostridia bacterium]
MRKHAKKIFKTAVIIILTIVILLSLFGGASFGAIMYLLLAPHGLGYLGIIGGIVFSVLFAGVFSIIPLVLLKILLSQLVRIHEAKMQQLVNENDNMVFADVGSFKDTNGIVYITKTSVGFMLNGSPIEKSLASIPFSQITSTQLISNKFIVRTNIDYAFKLRDIDAFLLALRRVYNK